VRAEPTGPVGITGEPVVPMTSFRPNRSDYMQAPVFPALRPLPARLAQAGKTAYAGLLDPLISSLAGPRGEFEKRAYEVAYAAFHQMLSDLQDWSNQAGEMDLLAKQAMDLVDGDSRVKTAAANMCQADHIGRLMASGQVLRMLGLAKKAGISIQPSNLSVSIGEPSRPALTGRPGVFDAGAGAVEATPKVDGMTQGTNRQPGTP